MLGAFQLPTGRFEDSKKILIKAKFSEANPSTVFPKLGLKKVKVDPKNHISFRFIRCIDIKELILRDKYLTNERLSKITITEEFLDYANYIKFNCKYEGKINVALFNEMYTATNKTKIYDEYILGEESPLDHLGYTSEDEDSDNVVIEKGSFSLYLKTKSKNFSLTNKWHHIIDGTTTGTIKIDECLPVDKQRVFPVLPVLDVNYNATLKYISKECPEYKLLEKENR